MLLKIERDNFAIFHVSESFLILVSHFVGNELEGLSDAVLDHFLLGLLQFHELANQMIEYFLHGLWPLLFQFSFLLLYFALISFTMPEDKLKHIAA